MKKVIVIAVIIAVVVGAVVFFRKHAIFIGDVQRDEDGNVTGVNIHTKRWLDRHGGLAEE